MAATRVKLPDGSEMDSVGVICEGCEKPMSEHSCGSSFTVTSGAAGGSFKTGPRRKDPTAGPLCPHCGGRLHANMAGLAQDVECLARQYYVDDGTMADPFQRLPVRNTLEDMRRIINWAESLATPATYGRMLDTSGGSGTYASLKSKTEGKRAKKVKPAGKGERIEDLAVAHTQPTDTGTVTAAPVNSKPSKARQAKAPVVQPTPVVPAPAAELLDRIPKPASPPVVNEGVAQEDAAARRARRQAILAGRG